MSQSQDQRKEHPSTYFIQDRFNNDERTRIHVQDHMLTKGMGGVLPEQPDPTRLRHILDVGCGTGDWLIETAKAYPKIERLVGIDISQHILEYARKQAKAEQLADRVEFHVMDALRAIEFPQHSFDLVNQRFSFSYLRTWDWPNLLTKYLEVTRPGGVIRITEGNYFDTSTSAALTQLAQLGFEAFYRAGHFFKPEPAGVTDKIPELFRNFGLQDVQTRPILLEYYVGSEMMDHFFENTKLVFRTIVPFLHKWSRVPDNYEELYRQALADLQQPDCFTTGRLVTTWGTTKI